MSVLITIGDRKLGSILQQNGYINDSDLQRALERLGEIGGRLGDVLIDTGVISERKIARALENELGIPLVELSSVEIDTAITALLDAQIAKEEMAMPIGLDEASQTLRVAFIDPLNNLSVENIEDVTGYTVERYQALRFEMNWALATHYPELGLEVPKLQSDTEFAKKPLGKF